MIRWLTTLADKFNKMAVKKISGREIELGDQEAACIEALVKQIHDYYSDSNKTSNWGRSFDAQLMKVLFKQFSARVIGKGDAYALNLLCNKLVSRGHYTLEQIQPIRRELYQMLCKE